MNSNKKMIYELPIRYHFFFARFLVLFPYNPDMSGSLTYLAYVVLLTLFYHASMFMIILVTKRPYLILTESMARLTSRAVEFFYNILLCLAFSTSFMRKVQRISFQVHNHIRYNAKLNQNQILLINVTTSVLSSVLYLVMNFSAIHALYTSERLLQDWKSVFDVMEFMICSMFEIIAFSYFFTLGNIVSKFFCVIINDLSKENLPKSMEEGLEILINRLKIQFSAACYLFGQVAPNFQVNWVVYVFWILLSISSSTSSLIFLDWPNAYELITWWTLVPIQVIPTLYQSFIISRNAKKAAVRLRELEMKEKNGREITLPDKKDPSNDPEYPKFFAWDSGLLLSILAIALIYGSTLYEALFLLGKREYWLTGIEY